MSLPPSRFIQIDEDGYFKMDELRVADTDVGRTWLSSLRMDGWKTLVRIEDRDAIVEAFDAPFVARNVARDGAEWSLLLPYGYSEKFDPASLTIDEWDRFHGHSERGVPFTFSRAAQATFFNLVDDYDDDSITVDGRRLELGPWLNENENVDAPNWWGEFYRTGETNWDLGEAHPALAQFVPSLKLHRSRILVLGCGKGNDAAWFARAGHIVTAVDYSSEAIEAAKAKYGSIENLTFMQADAFALPASMDRSFDIVFEHTLYCAVSPKRRNELAKAWRRALVETGHLMGVFFAIDKPVGPPFGGSEWELRARLTKTFRPLYWQRLRTGPERWVGTELFLYAQKISAV